MKETVHNMNTVKETYETASSAFNALLNKYKVSKEDRLALIELVKESAYKYTKAEGHTAGMPMKLWRNVVAGMSLDDTMKAVFKDKWVTATATTEEEDDDEPKARPVYCKKCKKIEKVLIDRDGVTKRIKPAFWHKYNISDKKKCTCEE